MKKEIDNSHKYVFVFAPNWNQFRNFLREAGLDIDLFKETGPHFVYVDRMEKYLGYTLDVYQNAEIRVIGTFWEEAPSRLIDAYKDLEERIRFASDTDHD